MFQLKECCGCVDLRTGATWIAILQFIGVVLNGVIVYLCGLAWGCANLLNGVVGLVSAVCLMYGAMKYHKKATLVYLILQISVVTIFGYGIIVMAIFPLGFDIQVSPICTDTVISFDVIFALVDIYFMVCVLSFYKGLKSGKFAA